MKNNDSYFEILVEPYACDEIFVDFIASNIEPCIEEILSPYHLGGQDEDLSALDLVRFFSKEEQKFHQFIIRTPRNPKSILETLRAFSAVLSQRMGEEVGFGFGYKICQNQDWIEAYKQSILPVSVGKFYIRPSWHPKHAESNLMDLVIDPALAFGSGHHASTSMCLELLGEMDLKGKDVLDVGCGSGILSIAASKLGASVAICDTDPLAIEESHKNFALNAQNISRSWVGSISLAEGSYDVIVANILASILMMLKGDLCGKLKVGGSLILSGILSEYQEDVLAKFADLSVEQIAQKDEWVALKLAKLK